MGCDLAAQLHNAQILHNEGIHVRVCRVADQFNEIFGLPVGNQGIQGQMHRNAPDMAVFDCLGQGLGGEILCALARVKHTAAEVDGIGAVLYRSPEGLHGPGRCQ